METTMMGSCLPNTIYEEVPKDHHNFDAPPSCDSPIAQAVPAVMTAPLLASETTNTFRVFWRFGDVM